MGSLNGNNGFGAPINQKKGQLNQGKIRLLLTHALDLEQFAHEALQTMRESLSFSGESARENAQAVRAMGATWEGAMEWIRRRRGEPLPGSKRPVPDKEKPTKRKALVKPPRSGPAPAKAEPVKTEPKPASPVSPACGQDTPTPSGQPLVSPGPDNTIGT